MSEENETVSRFFEGAIIENSNVVPIANKKNKFDPKHKKYIASAPDANIREEIAILKMKQHFIRNGYDLHVEDTRHLLESYDARVYNTKVDFPWKVQIKTCYSSSINNQNRFEIRNISLNHIEDKYKNIPIFVFYICYDQMTNYGIENRSRIYLVRRADLIDKIKKMGYRDSDRLPIHTDDIFWIKHCANFDVFNQDLKIINDTMITFVSAQEEREVHYTIGELCDAETVCEELDIEFDQSEFVKFMLKNLKFNKKVYKKYIILHNQNIQDG